MHLKDHPDDLATMEWFMNKSVELMEAVAQNIRASYPSEGQSGNVHLLGTCRMGDDPDTSVIIHAIEPMMFRICFYATEVL